MRRRLQWAREGHFGARAVGLDRLQRQDNCTGRPWHRRNFPRGRTGGPIEIRPNPEFVGRLPVVATLEDLDEPSLKLILTQPKNALVKQYQRLFEMESIDLILAEEALGAIARKAIDRKSGARGLRSIMEGILLDTMFDLPSLEGVEEVVISKEAVEGTARPLYIYSERAHT